MSAPVLQAIDLRKHYPVRKGLFARGPALAKSVDGVNFSVPSGGTLGLIGESGCGKTTTAKLVLKLETPTAGEIRFAGESMQDARGAKLRAFRRSVQAVFQDPYASLNPRRTIFDAIAEPLVVGGAASRDDVRARVAHMLDVVGLPRDAGERLPHEFSGGQRQRVAIARGIVLDPQLLILDEPVSALDVSIRAQILNLLKDLQDGFGFSYFLISHDMDVVSHMSHQVAVMYLGKIVEAGATDAVMRRPKHPYTKALLSSRLPAHPDRVRDRIRLRGPLPSPLDPPSGCVFRTRCPIAQPLCAEVPPPAIVIAGHGTVACHFADAPAPETLHA